MHLNLARRRRAVVVLLAAALTPVLGVAVAQPASAHDRLLSSDPADGATVDRAPTELTLRFSADVLAAGAQVAVTTADGTVPTEVTVDGDEVVAPLPDDLPAGDWDVAWRVVSSDGHPIEGELAFTVAAASPSPSPSASPSASPSVATASTPPSPSTTPTASAGHVHEGGGTPGVDLDADGEAGWATAWLFPVAVLAVVGVAAAVLLQRRRRAALDDDAGTERPDEPREPHGPGEGPGNGGRPAS
ncbi:copper resistance protein CopC [Isoptericola sp. NPDC019693]|uniref:copper resistance CopC family protein n=1 Tax=Isoptericola sp. NPDC019693 TaxID=3364009 RepID=UPI00378DE228